MASYANVADYPAQIFQGLAPTLLGSFSDVVGRCPAYWICFTVYLAANVGLAVQTSSAALFILRCARSRKVADIATTAETGPLYRLCTRWHPAWPSFRPSRRRAPHSVSWLEVYLLVSRHSGRGRVGRFSNSLPGDLPDDCRPWQDSVHGVERVCIELEPAVTAEEQSS